MTQNIGYRQQNSVESINVLITDRFSTEAEAELRAGGRFHITRSNATTPTAEELAPVHVLVIRSRSQITSQILAQAPKLRVIVTCTSGFDHIDLTATQQKNVVVMFTPEANAASAAELTFGLMTGLARKLQHAHRAVQNGDWRRESLTGTQLGGKTLGIIGLGRIGSRVARLAAAADMNILAFDPYKDDLYFAARGATRVSLDEIFLLSDFVTCHVPATEETRDMIKPTILETDAQELYFINTSRGSVISESLLCEALDQGVFAGCALDVFEREPLPRQSKLLGRDNVLLSPHVGAATPEAFLAASREAARKIIAYFSSGSTSDTLPSPEIWAQGGFRRNPTV